MPIWLRKYTFNLIKEYYDKPKHEEDNKKLEEAKQISQNQKYKDKTVYKTKLNTH